MSIARNRVRTAQEGRRDMSTNTLIPKLNRTASAVSTPRDARTVAFPRSHHCKSILEKAIVEALVG
jgi:hypothetical protein